MQRGQVALLDGEAFAQGRHVEQIEDLADREAAVGQFQQVFDGDEQRVTAALALVGQGERDEAWVIAFELAEHGADVRRIAVDIRDHDDDIPRAQRGVGTEALEQLVVENFHFSLRAVGDVEANRGITLQVDSRP